MASMHFPKLRHCLTQNLQLVKAETPKCVEDTLGWGGGPFPLCIKDPGARGQLSFSFLKILLKTSHYLFKTSTRQGPQQLIEDFYENDSWMSVIKLFTTGWCGLMEQEIELVIWRYCGQKGIKQSTRQTNKQTSG